MSELHLLRPYWIFALLPCLILMILRWYFSANQSAWHKVCDKHLINNLLLKSKKTSIKWYILMGSIWYIAVFALAGPTWQKITVPTFRKHQALIIALDVSPSMLAQDIKPDRITRARYKVLDILKRWKEGQVGLVVFAGEGYTVSPLTEDAHTIENMVKQLTPYIMPEYGANIAAGLKQAQQLIKQAKQSQADIILITDSRANNSAIEAARALKKQGSHIAVIGIGTQQGAPIPTPRGYLQNQTGAIITTKLDRSSLVALANQGGGQYLDYTSNASDINQILSAEQSQVAAINQAAHSRASLVQWQDAGRYFILFLLPLCLLLFRRGWVY